MAKYTPEFKEQVKQAYLSSSDSLAAIAARFGVGERTIEGWCKEGGWAALKTSEKVVSIGSAKKTKPQQPINREPTPPAALPTPRRSRGSGDIDELEIVTLAISDISALLGSEIDPRSIGSCATALCRLIELRLKLKPRSAAELAEQAIALGMSPAEFARELRSAWEKRA